MSLRGVSNMKNNHNNNTSINNDTNINSNHNSINLSKDGVDLSSSSLSHDSTTSSKDHCDITINTSFLPCGNTIVFPNSDMAHKNPFAQEVFKIPGVKALKLSDGHITVIFHPEVKRLEKKAIKRRVRECVLTFIMSGGHEMSKKAQEEMKKEISGVLQGLSDSPSSSSCCFSDINNSINNNNNNDKVKD
eukprot:Tbor_TRINITY_DN5597_c1_g1::TRINITY_DN5597_c1_g1_i1::g.13324::m.13324